MMATNMGNCKILTNISPSQHVFFKISCVTKSVGLTKRSYEISIKIFFNFVANLNDTVKV